MTRWPRAGARAIARAFRSCGKHGHLGHKGGLLFEIRLDVRTRCAPGAWKVGPRAANSRLEQRDLATRGRTEPANARNAVNRNLSGLPV